MATYREQGARELDALLARAVRTGRLDVWELLDSYGQLSPVEHPGLHHARQLDLETVERSLRALPAGFFAAERILVVPALAGFSYRPADGGVFASGWLADGTLLLEAGASPVALSSLAAVLCALAAEQSKAWRLMGEGVTQRGEAHGSAAGLAEEDPADAPAQEAVTQEGATPGAAAGDVDGRAQGDGVGVSMAQLAFDLGVDELALSAAAQSTGGALWHLLVPEDRWPDVHLHASLDGQSRQPQMRARAERIIGAMAEAGLLAGRPVHLWLGRDVVSHLLSPYVRDLQPVLTRWAQARPDALGGDVGHLVDGMANSLHAEDVLYCVAEDFLAHDARLRTERAEADRCVGVLRLGSRDEPFEVIDLGRLQPHLCDVRLRPWLLEHPAPVLLRWQPPLADTEGAALWRLLTALGSSLQSVTWVGEGHVLGAGAPGTVVLPQLMVDTARGADLFFPVPTQLGGEHLGASSDAPWIAGDVLSAPCSQLACAQAIADGGGMLGVRALDIGGAPLMRVLIKALWRGVLPADVGVAWAVVGTELAATGRPTHACWVGHSGVALARLQQLLPAPRPAAPRPDDVARPSDRAPPASAPVPRSTSGRTVRIKA